MDLFAGGNDVNVGIILFEAIDECMVQRIFGARVNQ